MRKSRIGSKGFLSRVKICNPYHSSTQNQHHQLIHIVVLDPPAHYDNIHALKCTAEIASPNCSMLLEYYSIDVCMIDLSPLLRSSVQASSFSFASVISMTLPMRLISFE